MLICLLIHFWCQFFLFLKIKVTRTMGTKFTRYKGCTGKNKSSCHLCLPATKFFPLMMYLLLILYMYLQSSGFQHVICGFLRGFSDVSEGLLDWNYFIITLSSSLLLSYVDIWHLHWWYEQWWVKLLAL